MAPSLQPSQRPTTNVMEEHMLKRYLFTTATAALFATAALTAQVGQTPSAGAPPRPSPTPQSTVSDRPGDVVTMVGCLKNERDVPGRAPNVAERAGILEDYILTNASPAAQSQTASGPSTATPGGSASSAVGTAGSAAAANAMFKIEGIDDERLKNLVGKRVEVTGRIDDDDKREAAGGTPAAPQTSDDDMPEFEATSIREVPGACDR
jgi:hypothetical protein